MRKNQSFYSDNNHIGLYFLTMRNCTYAISTVLPFNFLCAYSNTDEDEALYQQPFIPLKSG